MCPSHTMTTRIVALLLALPSCAVAYLLPIPQTALSLQRGTFPALDTRSAPGSVLQNQGWRGVAAVSRQAIAQHPLSNLHHCTLLAGSFPPARLGLRRRGDVSVQSGFFSGLFGGAAKEETQSAVKIPVHVPARSQNAAIMLARKRQSLETFLESPGMRDNGQRTASFPTPPETPTCRTCNQSSEEKHVDRQGPNDQINSGNQFVRFVRDPGPRTERSGAGLSGEMKRQSGGRRPACYAGPQTHESGGCSGGLSGGGGRAGT